MSRIGSPRAGDGRESAGSRWPRWIAGAIVVGALGWIGNGLMQSSHQWMCGWARGPASWLGDCAAYEQKPTQVVVPMDLTGLSGPKTKSQIKAEKKAFDQRRFVDAVVDNDKVELDLLSKEGFQLTSTEVCEFLRDPRLRMRPSLAAELERFATERIACKSLEAQFGKNEEPTKDGPTTLLYNYRSFNQCWHRSELEILSLIDSWISIRPSEDLRRTSKHLLKAYHVAAKASHDELKQLCRERHARKTEVLRGISIFRTDNKDDFIDAVFSFSASCENVGELSSPKHRMVMEMDESISSRNGAPPRSIESRIASACSWLTEKTGVHPKAAYMSKYLERWSK